MQLGTTPDPLIRRRSRTVLIVEDSVVDPAWRVTSDVDQGQEGTARPGVVEPVTNPVAVAGEPLRGLLHRDFRSFSPAGYAETNSTRETGPGESRGEQRCRTDRPKPLVV